MPLVVSAQQVDYHVPGLPPGTHLRLNAAVLAGMYSGSITAWNDPALAALNPGVRLPGTAVVPVHRSDASGDTFLFTSYLAAGDPAWSRAAGYGTTVAWPGVPRAAARRPRRGSSPTPGEAAQRPCSARWKPISAGRSRPTSGPSWPAPPRAGRPTGAGAGRHRGRGRDGGRERLGPGPPARGVPLTA
ncbi:MAG TPA: substrate-binding domain-containing protein [Streptosporangiaceae bacterium]